MIQKGRGLHLGMAQSILTTVAIGSLKLSKLLIHLLPDSLKISPTILLLQFCSKITCSCNGVENLAVIVLSSDWRDANPFYITTES